MAPLAPFRGPHGDAPGELVTATAGYHRAASLEEALVLLERGGEDARPLAGGQSLVPIMNLGLADPPMLVDISQIPVLREIHETEGFVTLGAAVRHHELLTAPVVGRSAPLLAAAAEHIGSARIRNVGTLGGSLSHADPLAELPLACTALDATYNIVGRAGTRTMSAHDFSRGYYETALEPGEILASVSIPVRRRAGWGFHEYARRAGDFAVAAAAAQIEMQDGAISRARVVLAGVADRPTILSALEDQLLGAPHSSLPDIVASVSAEVDPSDDPFVPAAYRRRLAAVLARRAVEDAVEHALEAE